MIRTFTTDTSSDLKETKADAADVSAALALKAPLASPAFTGNPTAPTPASGDNDTSMATTAFVEDAITTSASTLAKTAMIMQFAAAQG